MIPSAIILRSQDDVAVAARRLEPGEDIELSIGIIPVRDRVGMGHKIALRAIPRGAPVRKYGQVIGFATRDISAGSLVHVDNLEAGTFSRDYAFSSEVVPVVSALQRRTFEGYDRGDGRFGTRNYVALVSTVNCSASTSRYIVRRLEQLGVLKDFPGVDGVVAVTHKAGCAMQYGGPDHLQLDRTLAGFARHANVAAYIIIGLGCETGQAAHLIEGERLINLGGGDRRAPLVLNIQELGGIARTVEAGTQAIINLLPEASRHRRTTIGADKLILATNCGGSDGNSGVTANPALGIASDLLVAQGGTTVLAETTEIYGAEHLLTRRAITPAVGEKLIERIRWWERYTGMFGAEINNNPSPGNKDGGLTTIYEKSLGAIAKAGSTPMVDVVHYAEPIRAKGFVVMDTPGYDPVSMTGLVAGGANVCVFTTGRGSVFGCKPAPSIKVATNTPMYQRMEADMDVNAGVVLDGVPVEEVGHLIFEEILAVASGKKTKSELEGVGEEEFAPWSIGPTL